MPSLAAGRNAPSFSLPEISSDSEGSDGDNQPSVIIRSRFNWEEEEEVEGANSGTTSGTQAGLCVRACTAHGSCPFLCSHVYVRKCTLH